MTNSEDEYGTPDDENPEWTDEDFLWSVWAQDFGGDSLRVHAFLTSRENFLREAEAAGLPRIAFLSFDPKRPGFVERASHALSLALAAANDSISSESTKHAAE
jgi:hypothetical protein